MKVKQFLKQFNWRFLLVRILVNAIALALTAALVPKIYFVDKSIWNWLLMAFMLGVLNALIKPVLQFLTLQFLFVTYGLVIVVVNTVILLLLSFLFPARFEVGNLLWALVGGLVLGLLSSFLESLLGLTIPIVPDEPPELRHQIEEEARHVGWLAAAGRQPAAEQQVLVAEKRPDPDVNAIGTSRPTPDEEPPSPTEVEVEPLDGPAAPPAGAEPSASGPEEQSSPLVEAKAEPFDPLTVSPVEGIRAESPEPAPEPGEEPQEDGS